MSKREVFKNRVQVFVNEFINNQQTAGFIVILCAVLALSLSNFGYFDKLSHFIHLPLALTVGSHTFELTIGHFVNDVLMAIFFLMVGLEIKRELISGELSTFKKALLPVAAAIGGMLIPAFIFIFFNHNESTHSGWGIPMATDIAFALAVLAFLGNRVPLFLKVFLVSLAVADDLGAILVIAIFYTKNLSVKYLGYALLVMLGLSVLNFFRVKWIYLYFVLGIILWFLIYKSGIHATLSGVVLSLFIPFEKDASMNPSVELAHDLQGVVNFLILPLFAFCNTVILIRTEYLNVFSPLSLGIILRLVAGKALGIFGVVFLLIKLKFAEISKDVNLMMMAGIAALGGIGFTMSFFVALLSFENPDFIEQAKISIIIASLISALIGYSTLLISTKKAN